MDLTVSTLTLEAHDAYREALWYAPGSDGGRVYWAAAAAGEHDSPLAQPYELLAFAPEDGASRTLSIDVLGWGTPSRAAELTWCSPACDLVIVSGFAHWPQARLFGPLRHAILRYQLDERWAGNSLALLPGGLWRWVPEGERAEYATTWTGAMGLMV